MKTKLHKSIHLFNTFLILALFIVSFNRIYSQQPLSPDWWPDVAPCDPSADPCTIIQNGSPLDDSSPYLGAITPNPIDNLCTEEIYEDHVIECWFPLSGTPGVPMNLPPFSSCPGTATPAQMLNEFSLGASNNGHIASMGQLSNFVAGHTYNMYFKIRTTGNIDNFYIKLANHSGVTFPFGSSYGGWLTPEIAVANETVYTLSNINNPTFIYYCLSFTPTSTYDMIYLVPQLNPGLPLNAEMLYISDIHVFDLTTAVFPQSSYILNCNQTTAELGNPDCTLPAGGTWNWTLSPPGTITGANTANPTIGPIINSTGMPINYTVTATYSLPGTVGACSASVNQSLIVYPNPTTTNIVGTTAYCNENQLNFSTIFGPCSGCNYFWYISSGSSTIVSGTETLPNVVVDTDGNSFTLNVEIIDQNGCMYTATITVNNNCCVGGQQLVLINTSSPIMMSTVNSSINAPGINNIYIQGELVINGTYSLIGKNITFGQGSKITLLSGSVLTIGTSANPSHLHGCNYMWQGIDATQPGCLVSMTKSIIEDAIVAVSVKGNSNHHSYWSTYRNNYVGILYESHTSPSPNEIRRCTFITTATNDYVGPLPNPGYLLPPYFGNHGQVGIMGIASTLNFASTGGVSGKNNFSYLQNGIIPISTNLKISNANFNQIKDFNTGNFLIDGRAIYAWNFFNIGNYNLQVDNSTGLVQITNSHNAIWVTGTYTTKIQNNIISNITLRGIYHEYISPITTMDQLTVTDNRITNAYEGIHYYGCGMSKSRTERNILLNTSHIANSKGIMIDEKGALSTSCSTPVIQIRDNQIRRFTRGIYTSFASCMNIYNNDVYMLNPWNEQYHGIWLEISSNSRIESNYVYGQYQDWRAIGTRFFLSPNNFIGCNYIDQTGYAMWLDAACNNSNITNNVFRRYANGVFLVNNAIIGDQYISGSTYNSRNQWQKLSFGSSSSDMEFTTDGTIFPANAVFHFLPTCTPGTNDYNICDMDVNSNGSFFFSSSGPLTTPTLNLLDDATSQIPFNISCGGGFIQSPKPGIVQSFTSGFVADVTISPFLNPEHTFMFRHNILKNYRMVEDTLSILTLPLEVDSMMNEIINSPIAMIDSVDKLISWGNYSLALSVNSVCGASCNYSNKQKETNDLLIPLWQMLSQNDTLNLDSLTLDHIYEIANLCIEEYGHAVLKARVFVTNHIDPFYIFADNCPQVLSLETRNEEIDFPGSEPNTFNVYPNPATNNVNISYNGEDNIEYRLYDMQGRLLKSGYFNTQTTFETIEYESGIYMLELDNQTNHSTQKFKIIVSH